MFAVSSIIITSYVSSPPYFMRSQENGPAVSEEYGNNRSPSLSEVLLEDLPTQSRPWFNFPLHWSSFSKQNGQILQIRRICRKRASVLLPKKRVIALLDFNGKWPRGGLAFDPPTLFRNPPTRNNLARPPSPQLSH